MALEQWNIEPASRRCAASGQELKEGQEFYAVLYEEGESFRREDYALDAWKGPPEGTFCHFRSRIPVKTRKQRLFADDDTLVSFFLRLANAQEETKIHFRFVLSLILLRKRLIRYERTCHDNDREYWVMRLTREPADESGDDSAVQKVLNPRLDDRQIEAVSRELGAILHGPSPADETGDDAPASDPAREAADA
jgi:hypothetical protein